MKDLSKYTKEYLAYLAANAGKLMYEALVEAGEQSGDNPGTMKQMVIKKVSSKEKIYRDSED